MILRKLFVGAGNSSRAEAMTAIWSLNKGGFDLLFADLGEANQRLWQRFTRAFTFECNYAPARNLLQQPLLALVLIGFIAPQINALRLSPMAAAVSLQCREANIYGARTRRVLPRL